MTESTLLDMEDTNIAHIFGKMICHSSETIFFSSSVLEGCGALPSIKPLYKITQRYSSHLSSQPTYIGQVIVLTFFLYKFLDVCFGLGVILSTSITVGKISIWPLAKTCVIYNCNGRSILTVRDRISTKASRKMHFITVMN